MWCLHKKPYLRPNNVHQKRTVYCAAKLITSLYLFTFSVHVPLLFYVHSCSSDLSPVSYFWRDDPVSALVVTNVGYDANDKWTEPHSSEAQYHLVHVTHKLVFYGSHRKQVLRGLPSTITPPDIFLVLFHPLWVVFLSFSWPPLIKMQANFPAH